MGTKAYFNPELVTNTVHSLMDTYQVVMENVTDAIQKSFINKIGEVWHGQDAVRIMGTFVTELNAKIIGNGYIGGIEPTLASAVSSVKSAGQAWASDSEAMLAFDWPPFDRFAEGKRVTITEIKEKKEDGSIGMVIEEVRGILPVLNDVIGKVEDATNSAVTAVENSGFLEDYGVEDTLIDTMMSIKNAITTTLKNLNDAVEQAVSEHASKKEETIFETKNAFAGEK